MCLPAAHLPATNVALHVARPVRERRAAIEPVANNQPMVEDPGAPAAHLTPCHRQRWCFCVLSIYIRSGPPRTLLAPHTRAKLAGCTYMILRRRMLFNSLSLTFCKLRGCPTSASGASRGCRLGTIPLVLRRLAYSRPFSSHAAGYITSLLPP